MKGEGHKKQEKAMSQTFVNFSQVKTETATTLELNTFGFNGIVTLFGRNYQFFNPKFFAGFGTSG